MGDVKCYLRKMDFPSVVPEALRHIQKMWLPDCTSQQIGLMKELSEEFVFFEIDKWGNNRNQKLPPIKELQIVERIAWYFRQPENDQKMATFQFLFPMGSKILNNRLPILGKLLSLSIATENGNVLTYIGTWMQICECVKENSIFIAKSLIHEHIKSSTPSERMKNLPYISPVFCASLIATITNMYTSSCPPLHIIHIILDWINNVPALCYAPLKLNIPKSFNFSGFQTPIYGLIFWCVIAPLHNPYSNNPETGSVDDKVFSLLQMSLLQCMLKYNPREYGLFESVSANKLVVIVETLKKMTCISKDRLEIALNRFSMCMEIALSSGCLHPHPKSMGKLFQHCLQLPYNRPLKIVLQKWTQVVLHQDTS